MTAAVDGAKAAVRSALKVGVWVDDDLTQIDTAYARKLLGLGITEAALMVNRMNATRGSEPWKLRAPETTIIRAARALRAEGVDVVLTCWPRPDQAQIAALEADMGPLMRDARAVALEVDAEANWHPRFLRGFASMAEASSHLVARLREAAQGARVEMTTFAQHGENGRGAHIAPLVDACFPQAYSVNERGGSRVPWDHPFGPGSMQTLTHEGAVKAGAKLIGLGLAAYEQSWPGHTPDEAMRIALDRAASLGVTHVRYWSSKWIVGARGQAYPKRVIKAVTGA